MASQDKQGEKIETKNRLTPPNNFEPFDLWSKANFVLWLNVRFDFELVAEITRYKKSTRTCLELLNTINKYIKDAPEDIYFDGTVKCVKHLVKNNYLQIAELPNFTDDEKYLTGLITKYANKLDIIDIFSDISEPAIRAILLEYPNLLKEILNDELGRCLISQALMKNGISDYESFVSRVDDGENSIEVDKDKYSKEAMKCKIIYLGLRMYHKKLQVHRSCTELINLLSTLNDKSIEDETYEKGIINSMYVSCYGSDEWNKEKKTHLTGCELLYTDFQLLTMPDNHMSMIYETLLKDETDIIGKKYFGDSYRPEGFIASLAIKMAIVIILFRAEIFKPKNEVAEVDFFGKGAMLDGLNYAVTTKETEKGKVLTPKQWFIDYYSNELDKRVAFIKLQVDKGIAIAQMRDIERVIYLPVFESFRFFCTRTPLEVLRQIIRLFSDRNIGNEIKDDILINFVINIQKIIGVDKVSGKTVTEEENYFKDAFIILIGQVFENLIKRTIYYIESETSKKSYYERQDLFGDANIAIIELILKFDLSKCDSFIGYLSHNLRLNMRTSSRVKKSDQNTDSESNFEEGFLESIPDVNNFIEQLEKDSVLKRIQEHIGGLPEQQKEAIRKLQAGNEQLTETERRNKNRGLNKIREIMAKS